MIKCTGICAKCGRCKGSAMMAGANDRKIKMLAYPDGFTADKGQGLGAAFDIGTTTVVGMLWDLEAGEQIATAARTNPQNEFGMDVISRITYCGKEGENLQVLRDKITGCFEEIIDEMCQKAGVLRKDIVKAAACGNTTMSHLFAGYPPMSLARAPFDPAYTGTLRMSAEEAQLDLPGCREVIVVPNIAGHVGGDITAGIVASRVLDMEGLTIFIDIGTNGEIVLTNGCEAFACSTAAGPAFEGSSIKCGMRAAEGAIEMVEISDGVISVKTIGDKSPQGICGSGLIDAIAQMLDAGVINKSGRLKVDDGSKEFALAGDVVITQNDIREVQLAKGAIKAGIELMLARLGKGVSDLDRVVVAGAFGNYIDKKSAVRIGLLPDIPLDRIIAAGNTAGAGVSMVMVSDAEQKLMEQIPSLVKHVELAEEADFQDVYINSMSF